MDGRRSRWRRTRFAFFELVALLVLTTAVIRLGASVGDLLQRDGHPLAPGCVATGAGPNLLRVELAVPDRKGDESLPTLAEVVGCRDKAALGERLRGSTHRDLLFIPAYTVLLLWCGARMGGLGGRDGQRSEDPSGPRKRPKGSAEHPRHTRRGTLLAWLVRRRNAFDDPGVAAARRNASAAARRAIDAARDAEGMARWRARHKARPDGLRLVDRWRQRRQDRKHAKKVRKETEDKARRVLRAGGRPAESSGPGAQAPAPPPRRRRIMSRVRRVPYTLALAVLADGVHLARVDRNERTRLTGQIGAWSVLVAGVLDLAEDLLLLRTARELRQGNMPDGWELNVTAGLALAKFVLLVLPVVLAVLLLWLLVQAMFGSGTQGEVEAAVHLPDPAHPDRRWAIPVPGPRGGITAVSATNEGHYGICFSGGGIRSATFALGAIQELEATDPVNPWRIDKARYLSAVSGGSYMAATYQFLAKGGRGADPAADVEDVQASPKFFRHALQRIRHWPIVGRPARWAYYRTLPVGGTYDPTRSVPSGPLLRPSAAVEDHLRRHSTHLADGAAEWAQALGEMTVRAVTGLFILLLVIWTVAVPIGWAYRYGFHGLHKGDPDPTIDLRIVAGPVAALVAYLVLRLMLARPADALSRRWVFSGGRITKASDQTRAATSFGLAILVGLAIVLPFVTVAVESGVTTIGRWVGVASDPPSMPDPVKVNGHLEDVIAGTSDAASAASAAAAIPGVGSANLVRTNALLAAAESAQLAAVQADDAVGSLARLMDPDDEDADDERRPSRVLAVRFDPEACTPVTLASEVPVPRAEESVAVRACTTARSAGAAARAVADVTRALAGASASDEAAADLATASTGATLGASRASSAVRRLADELSGSKSPATTKPRDAPIAWAGLSALIPLIGGIAGKRRLDVGNRPKVKESSPNKKESGSNKVAKTVGFGGAAEVIAGVATTVLGLIAFSDVVVDSWQRSATGELKLIGVFPAWTWWAGAAILLVLLLFMTNANNWSLRPFYHRRLWLSYAVTPQGKTAPWRTDTRLSELGEKVDGRPELIICAAAQTSGREWAPPGRRALSVVFTALAVGGPEVGYMRTRKLEAMLGRKHRSAISLFGSMATSGAAFGPAMGRQSKGGLGTVMAIANARLGAWLPNPHHLACLNGLREQKLAIRSGSLVRWPRLWYWFMEIIGQYPTDSKLVLTSDGGHVENLGLVELLRRRCSRVLCFDASGAGTTPATLAEAIVMAREELDVQIILQAPQPAPDSLPAQAEGTAAVAPRPDGHLDIEFAVAATPVPPAELLAIKEFSADPLRRRASMVEALAARIAARPVVVAKIVYPPIPGAPGFVGKLVYGTLALADDGPEEWDLLEYAHRNEVFPNDGTARQWFDASTFSAYQQLGRRTAKRMLHEATLTP